MRLPKACFILALFIASVNLGHGSQQPGTVQSQTEPNPVMAGVTNAVNTTPALGQETDAERLHQRRLLLGLIVALLAVAAVYLFSCKQKQPVNPGR